MYTDGGGAFALSNKEQDPVQSTATAENLRQRIEDRTALVGIIGLGYVGLPLALTFAEKQFTSGVRRGRRRRSRRSARGDNYIRHLDGNRLHGGRLDSGRLRRERPISSGCASRTFS